MVERLYSGTGIFNLFAIAYAFRPRLRTRLTLRRLTLLRNPWIFGGRIFHPPYRYLCLHLRFHQLQHGSRHTFDVDGMLPYHCIAAIRSFGIEFESRLLSAPSRLTSELLRTL
jgi:hypothetical protein